MVRKRSPQVDSHREWLATQFIQRNLRWVLAIAAFVKYMKLFSLAIYPDGEPSKEPVRDTIARYRRMGFKVSNSYIPYITKYIKQGWPELKDYIS